jgi:hypothetical protein
MTPLKYRKAHQPIDVINDAIERKDWFSAYSNAVAYFELWGNQLLTFYCRNEHIYASKMIQKLSVANLVLVLYLLKLIDQNTLSKMNLTIKERNNIVHAGSRGERESF